MYKIILKYLVILILSSSCTINIIQTHTQGYADAVGDTTSSEDVSPDISVPLKGI